MKVSDAAEYSILKMVRADDIYIRSHSLEADLVLILVFQRVPHVGRNLQSLTRWIQGKHGPDPKTRNLYQGGLVRVGSAEFEDGSHDTVGLLE
jgi:hypothetical protein